MKFNKWETNSHSLSGLVRYKLSRKLCATTKICFGKDSNAFMLFVV